MIKQETKYCLAPPINPIMDLGAFTPLNQLVYLGVIQYVDTESFGWRKSVIVGKYKSFPVMNESEFRQLMREQAIDLSPEEFNSNIDKLIQSLEKKYKQMLKKNTKKHNNIIEIDINVDQMDNNSNNNNNSNNKNNKNKKDDDLEEKKQNENEDQGEQDKDDKDTQINDLSQSQSLSQTQTLSGSSSQSQTSSQTQTLSTSFIECSDSRDYQKHVQQSQENEQHNEFKRDASNYQYSDPENIDSHELTDFLNKYNELDEINFDNVILNEDDEYDPSKEQSQKHFEDTKVTRNVDLWHKKHYQMLVWTKNDKTYRVFAQRKTSFNLSVTIQKFISDWSLLSYAWNAQNEKQLDEYNRLKKEHDKKNKSRGRKWQWFPRLTTPFNNFWSVHATTDFGMSIYIYFYYT